MATQLTTPRLSSIVKKQIVAVTGLMMVGFLVAHLAGNTLIFFGSESFNHYAEMLASLGEFLWVMRIGLIVALVAHVYFTIRVLLENRDARGGQKYAVDANFGKTNFAKKFMWLTGVIVFFFVFIHLSDFTFPSKVGAHTVIAELGEEEMGLYGIVWNKFSNPIWSLGYVIAMACIGTHLSHGIQSLIQTLGIYNDRYERTLLLASHTIGALVAIGFASIPLYVIIGTPS